MTTLERFRVDEQPKEFAPEPGTFGKVNFDGRLLAVDQSLAHTGWSTLIVRSGAIVVLETGDFKRPAGSTIMDRLDTGLDVWRYFGAVFADVNPTLVVFELPIGGRGSAFNPGSDSSTLAALALRIAASEHHVPVQALQTRAAKKHATGNGNATKKMVTDAIKRRFPDLVTRKLKPLNEAVYDSIAIGVTFLEKHYAV